MCEMGLYSLNSDCTVCREHEANTWQACIALYGCHAKCIANGSREASHFRFVPASGRTVQYFGFNFEYSGDALGTLAAMLDFIVAAIVLWERSAAALNAQCIDFHLAPIP